MATATKGLKIMVEPSTIMYISISSSKSGYNYASVVSKMGDEDYMNISYEWKDGEVVPDFALEIMSIMQSKKMNSGIVPGQEKAYAEYASKRKSTKED